MKLAVILFAVAAGVIGVAILVSGDGSFKRMVTISGVYPVCRPGGYEVVCFLDADGHDGGLSCLPLKDAGGGCK